MATTPADQRRRSSNPPNSAIRSKAHRATLRVPAEVGKSSPFGRGPRRSAVPPSRTCVGVISDRVKVQDVVVKFLSGGIRSNKGMLCNICSTTSTYCCETRQLSRHLSHCRPCRRHAVLARGAGAGAVAQPPAAVVRERAGVAYQEPAAVLIKQSAGAIVRRAAGALVLRKSAGDLPARPVERPITLASRRRPAAEDPAIAAPGSDSLAVA